MDMQQDMLQPTALVGGHLLADDDVDLLLGGLDPQRLGTRGGASASRLPESMMCHSNEV
jgi:hypothetical protein